MVYDEEQWGGGVRQSKSEGAPNIKLIPKHKENLQDRTKQKNWSTARNETDLKTSSRIFLARICNSVEKISRLQGTA
jgi:hypothetical protein